MLVGQSIDRNFYDNLNAYTGEAGSDGVVRAAAANMNYGLLRLEQQDADFVLSKDTRRPKTAFGVLPKLAHSGPDLGIMGSVRTTDNGTHPTVQWTLLCLQVSSATAYARVSKQLDDLTAKTQQDEQKQVIKEFFVVPRTVVTNRYCMLVFRVTDDRDRSLADYDVTFTAGPDYDPNHLPVGFFVDRQRNSNNPGKLTYFIDYDVMNAGLSLPELQGKFGFRISARPAEGFAYYALGEHRGTFSALKRYFEPNQTVMVDIQLRRHVREGVFRLTQSLVAEDFRQQAPGEPLPPEA